jgi:SUF system NifU family Fe-S assembly protein
VTELEKLYQATILEHNRKPRGWGAPPGADRRAREENPFCGDRVTVHLRVAPGPVVADVGFEAQACAIAKASASMMTEAVRGKSRAEIEKLRAAFAELVHGRPPPDAEARLGSLVALGGVAAFPVRIACALLPWTALGRALDDT